MLSYKAGEVNCPKQLNLVLHVLKTCLSSFRQPINPGVRYAFLKHTKLMSTVKSIYSYELYSCSAVIFLLIFSSYNIYIFLEILVKLCLTKPINEHVIYFFRVNMAHQSVLVCLIHL